MQLPIDNVPTQRTDPRLLLLYGPPKIGKSTAMAQLPRRRHLILSCDPRGYEFLSACYIQINNMAEYVEALNLAKNKYDFLVIDTIDMLELWSEYEATIQYKKSAVGKTFTGDSVLNLPNGGGYLYLRQTFLAAITRCLSVAQQVIFVGHIRDKLIGQVFGQDETYTKDLDLTGKCKAIVCSTVDTIGYVSRDKDSNLTVAFKTHELVTNGSRAEHLKGRNFTMKGSTFDWSIIYPDWFKANPQTPQTV